MESCSLVFSGFSEFVKANVHYAEWASALGSVGVLWWAWHEATAAGRRRDLAVLGTAHLTATAIMQGWMGMLTEALEQEPFEYRRIERLLSLENTNLHMARLTALNPNEMPTIDTLGALISLQTLVARARQTAADAIRLQDPNFAIRALHQIQEMGPMIGKLSDQINRVSPPRGLARLRNVLRGLGWMKPLNATQPRHEAEKPS